MSRATRGFAALCLLAALVAATGFVMTRNRKMSLFLEARDRIGRGEPAAEVLAELADFIDWHRATDAEARAIVEEALGTGRSAGSLTLFRAGDWALLRGPGPTDHLLERIRTGWKEFR